MALGHGLLLLDALLLAALLALRLALGTLLDGGGKGDLNCYVIEYWGIFVTWTTWAGEAEPQLDWHWLHCWAGWLGAQALWHC